MEDENSARSLSKQEAFQDVAAVIEKKYSIISSEVGSNHYSFRFQDGRIMETELVGEGWQITGSAVGGRSFLMPNLSSEDLLNYQNSPLSDYFHSQQGQSLIYELGMASVEDSNGRIQKCMQNESFDQCFVRELQDFCDGIVGCVTVAFLPEYVLPVIAGHCAGCYIITEL